MPHCTREHTLAFLLPILGLGLASCGSPSSVPQVHDASLAPDGTPADAAIPDAAGCACPGTELLSREHFLDTWTPMNSGYLIQYLSCERETDRIIGGGCAFANPGVNDTLSQHSFENDRTVWLCRRQTMDAPAEQFVRCIRPLDRTGQIGEECTCPELETPLDRFFYVDQTVIVPAEGVSGVDASCPAGSVLVGGGCYGGHDSFTNALIIGGGIRPDDPQTWHCAWHSFRVNAVSSVATAVCLGPPGPDAVTGESVAPEVIEHVHVEEALAAGSIRVVDATCPPGDTLISGGCHVEDARHELADLQLKRSTALPPEDNRPNTWQCAWRNATDVTANVVATATCLKKPGATPSQLP